MSLNLHGSIVLFFRLIYRTACIYFPGNNKRTLFAWHTSLRSKVITITQMFLSHLYINKSLENIWKKWGMDINIVSSTVVRHAGIQVTRVQRLLTTGDILCKSVILQGFPFLQSALVWFPVKISWNKYIRTRNKQMLWFCFSI